jgi:hypothetical protein
MTTGERVVRAEDGVLYLVGGANDAASLYDEAGFAAAVDLAAWQRRLAERRRLAASLGVRLALLIVPEKLSVAALAEADRRRIFGATTPDRLSPPGRRFARLCGDAEIVYPDRYLGSQAEKFRVFTPTDSHWTWIGAFSAFQMLMTGLGRAPEYDSFVTLDKYTLRYHGDLWSPAFADLPADAFERVRLPAAVRRIYCNRVVGLKERLGRENEPGLHVGSHCIFANDAAEIREDVVLFGSSFSEYRLEVSLLTAVFAHYFRTVHFIWSTSIDLDYIARHRPHLVVVEMPERFLTDCPDDSFNVEAEASRRAAHWHACDQATTEP